MQKIKTGILIHERRRDALCRLHMALSKLGYVCEGDDGRSAFYAYRRASAKSQRKVAMIMLDFKRHTVHAGRKSATLNNHERLLLKYLVEHPCNVATRDIILDSVFGNNEPSGSDIISPCVCTLRRKLESIGHADVIKTIRGIGYCLSPDYIPRITLGTC